MKTSVRYRVLLLFPFVMLSSGLAMAANTSTPAPTNADLRRQDAEILKKDEQRHEEAHKKNLALFRRHDQLMRREEKMISQEKAMLAQQMRDIKRYDKILTTWKRQQAQYQKYLDSLNSK